MELEAGWLVGKWSSSSLLLSRRYLTPSHRTHAECEPVMAAGLLDKVIGESRLVGMSALGQ